MPYLQVQRDGKLYNFKRGADGRPEGQALGTFALEEREKADAQLRILEQAAERESGAKARYKDVDFKPTDQMAVNAARGRQLCEEHGRGGTAARFALAAQLEARETLSPAAVRRMLKAFERDAEAETKSGWSPGSDGYPSAGFIAHLLRGGEAGRVWAKRKVDEMGQAETELQAVKGLSASDAGSVGFGVRAEDENEVPDPAVAKFKVKDVVVIKSTNARGLVVGVKPTKSKSFAYTVATQDGGFTICAARDMTRTKARGVKDWKNPLTPMLLSRISGEEAKDLDKLRKQMKQAQGKVEYYQYVIQLGGEKPEYAAGLKKAESQVRSIQRKIDKLAYTLSARKSYRKAKNWTAAELAKRFNVKPSSSVDFVYQIVQDTRDVPSVIKQAAYGIRWAWFTGRLPAEVEMRLRGMNAKQHVSLIAEIARKRLLSNDVPAYLIKKYGPKPQKAQKIGDGVHKDPALVMRLLKLARRELRIDKEVKRRLAYETLVKADQVLRNIKGVEAKKARRALAPILQHWGTALITPEITPLKKWLEAINEAHQQVARIEIEEGTRSAKALPSEGAVLRAYHQLKQAQKPPPAAPDAVKAFKSLADTYAATWGTRKPTAKGLERARDALYEAGEMVRAHLQQQGDENATARLVALEDVLYADEVDDPAAWAQQVAAEAGQLVPLVTDEPAAESAPEPAP